MFDQGQKCVNLHFYSCRLQVEIEFIGAAALLVEMRHVQECHKIIISESLLSNSMREICGCKEAANMWTELKEGKVKGRRSSAT